MNVRESSAGYATSDHILSSGWEVYSKTTHSDMGQSSYTLTEYIKPMKFLLTGGYWTWYIKDINGSTLWEGWWNSNDEFDLTIKDLESNLK